MTELSDIMKYGEKPKADDENTYDFGIEFSKTQTACFYKDTQTQHHK